MFRSFAPIVYVQLEPDKVTVRNVKTGQAYVDLPEMAIGRGPQPVVLAVGSDARLVAASQQADLVKPFAHPRSMVSDFQYAELFMQYQIHRALGNRFFSLPPRVVLHPMGKPAGGYTELERRAFFEMVAGAGASEIIVRTGRPLTDPELKSWQFPPEDGVPN